MGADLLVGLVAAGEKAVSMFAEFDVKIANVARTTGLTKQEIYAISETLMYRYVMLWSMKRNS